MNISVSSINSFLRCERAWDIGDANRQSLRGKISPKIYLTVGSAVHEAIDAQAAGLDPIQAFEDFVVKEREERVTYYQEVVSQAPWESEMKEFEENTELARGLVNQYFDHYGWENPLEDLGLKYLGTEIPFSIPLGNGTTFVGTFDGIATDIDTESQYFLIENKTAGRKPNLETVRLGNQWQGYNWAFQVLTGETLAGTVYNGIMKRLIKPPKVLKSGELSKDKNAGVTLKSFLEGLQKGGQDPVKYLDYMTFLEEREQAGDDRFFVREKLSPYSKTELGNWYNNVLLPVSMRMKDNDQPLPNFGSCDGCFVADLCGAMQRDESLDEIIAAKYEVKTYGTIEAVKEATPETVGSVDDLKEFLNG